MSGRIKVEDGVMWLKDGGYSRTSEVHEFKGTSWYGEPELARVPQGRKSSPSNAVYEPTDGVMFGVNYSKAHYDTDGNFTGSWYDTDVVLHMNREEAINLAKLLLEAATGRHL